MRISLKRCAVHNVSLTFAVFRRSRGRLRSINDDQKVKVASYTIVTAGWYVKILLPRLVEPAQPVQSIR